MRRALFVLLTAGFLLSCSDGNVPSSPDGQEVNSAILDGTGTSGDLGDDPDLQANEFFFWLAPMVDQPDESQFGTFDPEMRPTVKVVCLESSQLAAEDCNPEDGPPVVVAEFTVGNGLVVETDHYKVDFDTEGLQTSSETESTTYRILALTPPLTLFGGPFVFGLADFQLGENGKEARNLDSSETIGLTDGRTLPVRFRLDEGAMEEELAVNTAPTDDFTGDRAFCQINCSVTVIDQDEDTEASLFDPDTDDEISAAFIPAGTAWTDETAVYVIDELVDDGDSESGELCLPFGEIPTEACYRHELSPDNPNGDDFQQNAEGELPRAGVCPTSEDQALVSSGSASPTWRFLKADEEDGVVEITRPPEVSVSDFLQCDTSNTMTLWDGPGGQLAGTAVQWLVPPLRASDTWGGQLQDLSDLFMGEDVEMTTLAFPSSATAGTTLQMTVQLTAVHNSTTPADREVTFSREQGTGTVSVPQGFDQTGSTSNSVTVETDGNGQATVEWEITEGSNRLEATSPHAELANADPDVLASDAGEPAVFEVTGTATQQIAFTSDRSGDDDLWVVQVDSTGDPVSGTVVQTTTDPGFDNGASWSPDGSHLAFHSDRTGSNVLDLWTLEVDATGALVGSPVQVTTAAGSDRFPAWSPDGSRIAFDSDRSGNTDVWTVEVDATGAPVAGSLVQVTTNQAVDNVPVWSPDQNHIAFVSTRTGNSDVWTVEVDATGAPVDPPVQVTTDPANDVFVAWSPDGSRLAFSSARSGNLDIWVVDVDASGAPVAGSLVQVTTDQASDSGPVWSPDGDHIAFSSDRGGGADDVWAVEVDATGAPVAGSLVQVTTDAADDFSPAWSTIP